MIKPWAFDLEVLPNFLSITFVNLADYLVKCKCVDDDNKILALTDKYTVKEIKDLLETVEAKEFYITDTDDSQLLSLIAFINQMQAHYEIRSNNGKEYQEAIRTDLYSFNGNAYDNLMVGALLMYYNRVDSTKVLLKKLHEISKLIIRLQNDKTNFYQDTNIKAIRNFKLPYASVDVMKIFRLDKCFKSLKQTSINLKWHELLEFELPAICDKDRHFYPGAIYEGIDNVYLTKLIDKWDRRIIPEYIPSMMFYNKNDVYIVCEIVRQKIDEIRLRYNISNVYGINVLSSSRSNIADKLFVKFYSQFSGVHPKDFMDSRTERTALAFKKIIFNSISFKTKALQDFLIDIKKLIIYNTKKDEFFKEVTIGNSTYTMAAGGLHSKDSPRVLYSTNDYFYRHFDVSSFYPSIIVANGIAPKHLVKEAFLKLIGWIKDTRIEAKHSIEEVIAGIPNKIVAEVFKIIINAIYGKLGSDDSFLKDKFALLQVTLNGQLFLLKLIEDLESNEFEVVSANTDGIVIKIYNNKIDKYNEIIKTWCTETGLEGDSEDYELYINRDVNSYIIRELPNKKSVRKVTAKGAMNPLMYLEALEKGFNAPIVAKAVSNYFLENIPVMDSLIKHTSILDFCKTQNVGKEYELQFTTSDNNGIHKDIIQRNSRYYITNHIGGILEKVKGKSRNRLAAGYKCNILNSLDDKDISLRDINYKYYYEQAMLLINPIKLAIGNQTRSKFKKYSGMYNPLFDNDDFNN